MTHEIATTPIRVELREFTPDLVSSDLRSASFLPSDDSTIFLCLARITTDLVDWARTVNLLRGDELSRLQRYRHPRAQTQFLAARTVLRTILGHWLKLLPGQVPIQTLPGGKPILGLSEGSRHFNLSHSDGLVVVALARRPVGVDVEAIRPLPSAAGLVQRFFALSEQQQYQQLPEELKLSGFFRGWVCKEAILKGVGCGACGLDHCIVDLDPRRPAEIVRLSGPVAEGGIDWSLALHSLPPHWLIAVAHADARPLIIR